MKALLIATVLFLLPISFTFAQSNNYSINSQGDLTINRISFNSNEPGANSSWFLFKNTYPTQSNAVAGVTAGNGFTGNRADLLKVVSPDNCNITISTIICDIEQIVGTTYGDGTYWLIFLTPNSSPTETYSYYNFSRTNAQWTPQNQTTPISNNSSIISTRALNPLSTSTIQSFTTQYVSGTPAPSQVCLQFEKQVAYLNSIVNEVCQSVTQSGVLTYATTTTLSTGFYTWYAVLKLGTTTISRSTLNTIQIGNSQYQTIITDYNSTTSIPSIDNYCNTLSSNSQGAWLVPACKMLMEIYGFSGIVLTNVFTFAYSQLLQTAPLSWALVVNNVWTQAQLTATTNTGINMQMPFNTNVSILEQNQVINQLGQSSVNIIHNLTTVFFGVMLWLYFRRVVFDRLI